MEQRPPRTGQGRMAVAYIRGAMLTLVSEGPGLERFMAIVADTIRKAEEEAVEAHFDDRGRPEPRELAGTRS